MGPETGIVLSPAEFDGVLLALGAASGPADGRPGSGERRRTDLEAAGLAVATVPSGGSVAAAVGRTGVPAGRLALIADDPRAVEAARGEGVRLLIGIGRGEEREALTAAGADDVVAGLDDVRVDRDEAALDGLPLALEHVGLIEQWMDGRRPAVFCDYDGTLTPIVAHAADADLPAGTRRALEQLARRCPVAIVSGRDLDDVRARVDVDGLHYAGSHGLDILTADGHRLQRGEGHRGILEAAEGSLTSRLASVPGARVERKRYAIAVHHRQVDPGRTDTVTAAVEATAAEHDRLRMTGGKQVLELRPDVDWDKGRALLFLLDRLGLRRPGVAPVYLGDDVTDEDAFRTLAAIRGLGVVVRGEADGRATAARLALRDPGEATTLLERVAAVIASADHDR